MPDPAPPLWYQDAIIYQLHVKAFCDSDGNGIGDFRGLTSRLDYLQRLGVTALWLLPFYPSPLKDDGYDIADYYHINSNYQTMREFKSFLRAARQRGLRVITELVLNHTSDQHPWFQRARRAPAGSSHRNFYVWSASPEKYRDARVIFQDFEGSNWSWDPVARAYYWHRFYAHQPDLNFDNPQVQKEMLKVFDFWFGLGVDGVRLDAVPYLFEREGTNCENLPETHAFLRKLRAHLDEHFPDRMLLAEANQWPEDAVAYFGAGDECHMAFHFPLMPRIFMALQMEDAFPIVDILEQTPALPPGCQWAIFLRNHDELTLEMVTDEERDYMYRVYARDPRARINLGIRRRLAPLIGNNRRKIELMNFLLLSLPGTPIIYYGDEIGMGDNYYLGDRDGVRTPMQWSPDRNAGFSTANPQRLYLPVIIEPEYHFETVNVETQERNPSSLLWWMRRMLSMRKRHPAFGRGEIEILGSDNPKVLAFLRRCRQETILVVVNLSRYAQLVHLELAPLAGMTPQELFGRNTFPAIREESYPLTMGSHDHFWFALHPAEAEAQPEERPRLTVAAGRPWQEVLQERSGERLLDEVLPAYLTLCRWFRGKARTIRQLDLLDTLPLATGAKAPLMALIQVRYTEGTAETYALPLAFVPAERARKLLDETPRALVAPMSWGDVDGVLLDALCLAETQELLLQLLARRRKVRGTAGELAGRPGSRFRALAGAGEGRTPRLVAADQSNSALLYGDRLFLKLYRAIEEGINPDPEITRFLSEEAGFDHAPPFAGTLEYRRPGEEPMVLALLQGMVSNQGDSWQLTQDVLSHFIERLLTHRHDLPPLPHPCPSPLVCSAEQLPEATTSLIGGFYLEMATLLGRRSAELHLALASNARDPAWQPEPFSLLYQRSVYQSMRSLLRRTLQTLARRQKSLSAVERERATRLLGDEKEALAIFGRLRERKFTAMKIRIHGDYHLGQVLFTGKDFIVIDFEGEPARPLSDRRLKRSPLRDVAGMLRSFHYAASTALAHHLRQQPSDEELLAPWLEAWAAYIGGTFLQAYRERLGEVPLIPADLEELDTLLNAFLLEKAVYELGYELNNRPDWVGIPLQGIKGILAAARDV
jgi:maltose alpha-D-glucosyltransferase/alpha-amylase